jgi:uncharacterized Zn-finger protein
MDIPLACLLCEQVCPNRTTLELHYADHCRKHALLGEEEDVSKRPFRCTRCPVRFTRWSNKQHHERTIHDKATPRFPCPHAMCASAGVAFQSRSKLTRHSETHKSVTNRSKPGCICLTCKRIFASTSSLRVHTMLHTNERPFTCLTCNRNFRTKQHIVKHIRTHAKDSSGDGGGGGDEIKEEGKGDDDVYNYFNNGDGDGDGDIPVAEKPEFISLEAASIRAAWTHVISQS